MVIMKNDETADLSTVAEPTKTYRHEVHPFLGDPLACDDFCPVYIKHKPKNELNFFLTTDESDPCSSQSCNLLGQEEKKNEDVEPESCLACSIVSRERISFEQLKNQVSSSPSGKEFKTKPVIIICHGAMSWRNQVLLVNLSSKLSRSLDAYILRFDFTGNGHSKGELSSYNFNRDYKDLSTVIDFVTNSLGCQVGCIIGHSQGTASVLYYASHVAKQELEGGKVVTAPKCFVNLAGRYVCNEHPDADQFQLAADLAKDIVHLRRESSIRVLTIHGHEDEAVPIQDAYRYDKEIANHKLYVIRKANHTFNGLKYLDEMVFKIFSHYNSVLKENK